MVNTAVLYYSMDPLSTRCRYLSRFSFRRATNINLPQVSLSLSRSLSLSHLHQVREHGRRGEKKEEDSEEEEERLFKANAVNEDPERDRATQV